MAITAPIFVAEYESTWDNSLPLSISTTTAVSDVLAAFGGLHNGAATLAAPSGGGLTWTEQKTLKPSTSYATAYLWSAPAVATSTFSTAVIKAIDGSALMGANLLRFSGSDGIGASASSNASGAAPTLTLTTTQDHSAIVMVVLDWNGTSGARTYRTTDAGAFTEQSYYQAAQWTVQGGYYADAGTAGAKVIGISAPAGQKYTILAMEVLGTEEAETVTGTIVEWGSTSDDPPTTTVGTVTNPDSATIQIAGGAGSANVRWNGDLPTENAEMGARFYAKYDTAWATGTVQLMSWFADAGSTLLGRLVVTNTGALRIVNAAGTTVTTSSTLLPLDTWLRYEVSWASGTFEVSVHTTSLIELFTLSGAVTSGAWQALWFGHTNNTQNPPTLSLANIIATDSAADSPFGARAGDAAVTTPVYRISNGLLVPMAITML